MTIGLNKIARMKTKLNFFPYADSLLLKFHDKIISPKKSPLSDRILFIFYERLHSAQTVLVTISNQGGRKQIFYGGATVNSEK